MCVEVVTAQIMARRIIILPPLVNSQTNTRFHACNIFVLIIIMSRKKQNLFPFWKHKSLAQIIQSLNPFYKRLSDVPSKTPNFSPDVPHSHFRTVPHSVQHPPEWKHLGFPKLTL